LFKNYLHRWEPMNPAPPVIRIRLLMDDHPSREGSQPRGHAVEAAH